jgi:hypothetical protein
MALGWKALRNFCEIFKKERQAPNRLQQDHLLGILNVKRAASNCQF